MRVLVGFSQLLLERVFFSLPLLPRMHHCPPIVVPILSNCLRSFNKCLSNGQFYLEEFVATIVYTLTCSDHKLSLSF